jgi:hypothetical protein
LLNSDNRLGGRSRSKGKALRKAESSEDQGKEGLHFSTFCFQVDVWNNALLLLEQVLLGMG